MYSKKRQFGNLGENLACDFLISKGFKIITRNYLKKFGELDIVAQKGSIIHFIEVKTVSREGLIEFEHASNGSILNGEHLASENVTSSKISKIVKTAQFFLFENGLELEEYQFDLITVLIFDGGVKAEIDLIENINIS